MSTDINEKQVVVGEASTPAMTDKTLEKAGFAADAAEVGRRLNDINERLNVLNPITATGISYDNTSNGLEADDVQGALNEMSANVADAVSKVDEGLEDALSKIDTKMGEYAKVSDKPSGIYTGNGSTAQRIIDVGGTGKILFVCHGDNNFLTNRAASFVFANGAIHIEVGSSVSSSPSANMNFSGGKLTLTTSSDTVNKKDVEYYYQVL